MATRHPGRAPSATRGAEAPGYQRHKLGTIPTSRQRPSPLRGIPAIRNRGLSEAPPPAAAMIQRCCGPSRPRVISPTSTSLEITLSPCHVGRLLGADPGTRGARLRPGMGTRRRIRQALGLRANVSASPSNAPVTAALESGGANRPMCLTGRVLEPKFGVASAGAGRGFVGIFQLLRGWFSWRLDR